MYNISIHSTPDIKLVERRAKECMKRGVRLYDMSEKLAERRKAKNEAAAKLQSYGINNPNSHPQIAEFLDRLEDEDVREICYNKEEDKWTSNAEALKRLSELGYEFADTMLVYRKEKSMTEAMESLAKWQDSNRFIHPKVSFGITNRVNYSDPALMNIPKELLWYVVAPITDEYVVVSADIKNQEPWILINMLDIKELKELMRSIADDEEIGLYHALFFKAFGGSGSETEISEFKVSWNALTYGGSKMALNRICKTISADTVYKFFRQFKKIRDYQSACREQAKRGNNEIHTVFDTKLYADDVGSKLKRQIMDMKIQGTGSDILALLIEHLDDEVEARGLTDDIMLYYSRHDELLLNVRRDYVEANGVENVRDTLNDILQHQVGDWEPFKVKIKFIGID